MYRTRRTSFPQGMKIEVPCYQINAFTGQDLDLKSEDQFTTVDLADFDAPSIANVMRARPGGTEICGLIAVDSRQFAEAFEQAVANGPAHKFGTVLHDVWYQLAPVELMFSPRAGEYVVIGLYHQPAHAPRPGVLRK
ncbi:hypothetical protein [Deinococcus sp. QL22]|uniref:hypothetical protein n=1 Tax=Deinococcus sp. QL22 TaxID=2939437 RepID=UPI002016C390|nr:hypothetical protein [Deinococcus sp. QL22]UQN08008.1 hypothetical protein M1R55_18110 [Deinococcus sp. QL22]